MTEHSWYCVFGPGLVSIGAWIITFVYDVRIMNIEIIIKGGALRSEYEANNILLINQNRLFV